MGPLAVRAQCGISGLETSGLVPNSIVRSKRPLTASQLLDLLRDDRCDRAAFAICRQCGRVDEFTDNGVSALQPWADNHGFAVERSTVALQGICAWCRSTPAVVTQQEGAAE